MTVCTVWYENEMGKALWSIYENKEKAEKAVEMILTEGFGKSAWYNVEEVL